MIKKLTITLLTLLFLLTLMPICESFSNSINAYSQDYRYDYSSNKMYEVDHISDSGTFEFVADFDDFESAKSLMKTSKNYVVRCKYGYSPTRIVAMNSGIVYSYPRGSSNTQDIYEEWGSNKYNREISYIERRYEMTYVDTPYMSSKSGFEGQGYVEVVANGFNGYVDTEYVDLIPSKFIDKGLSIYIGGPYATNSISAYSVIVEPNYYIVNRNGNYYDLEFHYHIAYPDNSGYVDEYKLKIDNAENYSFMSVGTKYYSDDGFNFYSDYKKTNYVGTCYGYYQFLPIRTKSAISASTLNSFLKSVRSDYSSSAIYKKGDVFVDNGDIYGCNSTLIYALACQESAYGTSGYAKNRNNLFGWNAFDDSPDDASYFSSVDNAIKENMGRNLRKYADYTDGRYCGTYVGNKGSGFNLHYASDPYWGMRIGAIYYKIDKYANGDNGNLTDYNKWSLGLITTFGASIYYDSSCASKICTANYSSTRQQANIVVLLEEVGDTYKIQFSNPIDTSVVSNNDNVIGYSWSKSIAYIKKSDVQVLNGANVTKQVQEEVKVDPRDLTHEDLSFLDSITLSNGVLSITGVGAISNLDFTDTDKISHSIDIYDTNSQECIKSIEADTKDSNGFSINDGFNYKYSGFSVSIDLKQLNLGSYYLKLKTTCGEYSVNTLLRSTNLDHRNIANKIDNTSYRFTSNQDYSYRCELDIENIPFDYSNINKPSKRLSLNQFNSLQINDDATIDFSGYAMIYYLNYNNADSNRYKLFFVDSSKNISKEYALDNIEISNTVKIQINSVYDISYIGFSKNIDLSELDVGTYTLVLQISTSDGGNNYYDLSEFNAEYRVLPSKIVENKTYSFITDSVRNRLILQVSEVN